MGYEFNILKAEKNIKRIISGQIEEYRKYENLILNGDFYRLKNPLTDGCYAYYIINEDKTEILVSYLQNEGDVKQKVHMLKIRTARTDLNYRNVATNEVVSGLALKSGICVIADSEERYGKTFYFVAEQ